MLKSKALYTVSIHLTMVYRNKERLFNVLLFSFYNFNIIIRMYLKIM